MIYIVVLAVVVGVLLITTVGEDAGRDAAARIFWWPGASCRGRCWCSRCSRRGSARAACLRAARTPTGTASPRCGSGAGGWVGLLVIFFIAGRARRFAQFTVPDLLETRYNVAARVLAHDRHRDFVHRDHQLPVQRRRRRSASDFSGAGPRPPGMYIIAAFVITFTARRAWRRSRIWI